MSDKKKAAALKDFLEAAELVETANSVPSGHKPLDNGEPPTSKQQLYVDRFGRRHGAAILTAWSPAALKALGVRPINPESVKEAPSATR
jgi:hypothetical protein